MYPTFPTFRRQPPYVLPNTALTRYPSACWASRSMQVWASPLASRLAVTLGRIAFVIILRPAGSPPVALDPASRRRRYLQLQAGERLPGEDLHPSDRVHSQTHKTTDRSPWDPTGCNRWAWASFPYYQTRRLLFDAEI